MAGPTTIGIACPVSSERAAFRAWLEAAGYETVPMLSFESLAREMDKRPVQALVADAAVVSQVGLRPLLKILTANRPLIVVGTLKGCPPELRHLVSCLDRPITPDATTMGVALALAEGRPARRSPRKAVLSLPATVDGVTSQVIDVSNEGVRLQLKDTTLATVPPVFTLRVEVFGVATLVKRAWVADPGNRTLVCGGRIHGHLPRSKTWTHLVAMAPPESSVTAI